MSLVRHSCTVHTQHVCHLTKLWPRGSDHMLMMAVRVLALKWQDIWSRCLSRIAVEVCLHRCACVLGRENSIKKERMKECGLCSRTIIMKSITLDKMLRNMRPGLICQRNNISNSIYIHFMTGDCCIEGS